jgi:hypothetical protein
VGKPLRNGGSYFLRKRRERKLEGGCRFVNGTFVGSGLKPLTATVELIILTATLTSVCPL